MVADNRPARARYEIVEKFETGIVLQGSEVKALRMGRANLSDAYARVKDGELYLVNAHIGAYPPAGQFQHEPTRERKLLMRGPQIEKIAAQLQQKGLALVPLRIYFNEKNIAKVELGLGRGKKLHDRREDIATREAERQMERARKRSGR